MKKKVLIAMSGGVDSSTTAALLLKEGYECIGAHMKLWKDPAGDPYPDTAKEAEEICKKLGISFHLIDLTDEFKATIVDDFISQYCSGETPNPCIKCNKLIKFGALLEKAKELGCDHLATGHYVKLSTDKTGQVHMYKGSDPKKDQSYFLYILSQEQLKHVLFPLGDHEKPKVRKLATKLGLPELEEKAESQDVCFYAEKSNLPFLKRHLKENKDYKKGPIKDQNSKVIGEHKGLPFYTLGQRKGIDIGGGPALYVQGFDYENNTLIVGPSSSLEKTEITLRDTNFISGTQPSPSETLEARIRHHGKLHKVKVTGSTVIFSEPPNAPMPGQSLVLYKGDEVIGGGIMT
jgi:tRNA-uridine 2-sulfurtransferase